MAAPTRLFARTREQHKDSMQLSSKISIIALFDENYDDISLRERLYYFPNCYYFRASITDDCLDFITDKDAKDDLIIFIISNRFIDFIHRHVPEIVPQLSHVYIFDLISQDLQFSSDQRFRGAFHDVRSLLEKIHHDIEEVRQRKNMAGAFEYILEDSAQFYWYRFFFNVLDRLNPTEIARRELISRLRDQMSENTVQLRMIDEFERKYVPEKVIWWYTRDSFFYRMLNKKLRENDINEIILWRSYIQDLDRSLRQLRFKQRNFNQITLYRYQRIYMNDLHKFQQNVGKLVSASSFLSATLNEDIAMMFGQSSLDGSLEISGTLWRIHVHGNDTKTIFADIGTLSIFPDEEECLFSLRSMFRINRVYSENNLWFIDVTAVDEDDQQFCTAINPWKATIGEQSFFSDRHEPLFTRYLNIENDSFLAFQLLIDLMLRLNQTDYAREEMIEMCRSKYADSPVDLKMIDKFEQTYRHQDAAKWYTTDSFLYRLLNNSLRLEDIDTLFKLRYYIYDLHNQLAQLQIPYIQSFPSDKPIITLYRGQRMKIIELNKLRENVGKLISKNSFLSTTNDVQAAIFFSGDGFLDNAETDVSVLYQITIDTSVPHSIPFAKIQYESIFEDEDEVLFSIASVFRIDEVKQNGNLWAVNLTLINKEDEAWNTLTAHLNK